MRLVPESAVQAASARPVLFASLASTAGRGYGRNPGKHHLSTWPAPGAAPTALRKPLGTVRAPRQRSGTPVCAGSWWNSTRGHGTDVSCVWELETGGR